jgi:tetratricopeptide (TPR) repeat protein
MFWKILLLIIAGLILIVGIGKIIWDAIQENPDLNVTRDLIVTIVLAFLAGIYPIIDLLRPSSVDKNLQPIAESQERIEQKIDQLRREIGEPIPYEDGIPQSENLNLRRLFEVGKKHLKNYEYDTAIKAFRAALVLQGVKPSECAALLIHIGIAQHKHSKWDEAEGAYKEALNWAEKGKDELGQADALGNLGLVYQDKGEWDKAIEFYNKDLEISKKIGDVEDPIREHGMAQTYGNLGNVYQLKEERDKAIEFYRKALKEFEKIGDEHGMAQTYGNLGSVYGSKGKWNKASEFYHKTLKGFEKIRDDHGIAQTYMNLGNVYGSKGNWDKAIEFYSKALKGFEKIGDERGIARTKANIGILYKEHGKKDEARKLLEESLRMLEKIGDRPNAEIVRKYLEDLQ